jgi:hypothetical protein
MAIWLRAGKPASRLAVGFSLTKSRRISKAFPACEVSLCDLFLQLFSGSFASG